ncbi:uncharacterized protein ACLA_073710 [Aspergillus clavatus NRRL 1]|uniref:Uncharacterized protein n=1 Tax=Aspergillus clavatus (strain ATCC 1007 / CBS 513.65 / DSM 816 / NCTC 3887 / NRRL 1 / QM 1276 / 107) TaxID=344612 RepID=A1C7G5_ASPCL|nr:uncharacterized protein ACLA_073710 [Aspergillus clavatus NRRL 1]EAW14336.1 conserved hypothetical protein [Aspergillus clavatus NRRL 1]
MKTQRTAGPIELNQNNIIRPLSHTTTSSSSNSSQSDSTFEAPSKSSHRLSLNASKRVFRPRSKSPSPISTELPVNRTRRSTSDGYNKSSPRTVPARTHNPFPQHSTSPTAMSPTETISQPSAGHHKRDNSYSSQNRRSSDDFRRYNGTVNHYGRHSNDWLFGGFSLRDTVRDSVDRLRHHGKES